MRRNANLFLEGLEDRWTPAARLLTTGVLQVFGTYAADRIVLTENPAANLTTVDVNGQQQSFLSSRIGRIDVYGYDGWDHIDASGVVTDVVRMFGGNGSDTLIGGQQRDLLYGQAGNDVLRGGRGFDYLDGGAHVDAIFRGGFDQRNTDRTATFHFDDTDGPPAAKPTAHITPGAPRSVTTPSSSQAGYRTALSLAVYSPAYSPVAVHSITVGGNFVGGSRLHVTRSLPNQTDDAGVPVAISLIRNNADGTKTIFFRDPVVLPSQSAMQFQVRFYGNYRPFDIDLRSVEIAGPAPNVEYWARIRWNVA